MMCAWREHNVVRVGGDWGIKVGWRSRLVFLLIENTKCRVDRVIVI
jgi:hypothetical protein